LSILETLAKTLEAWGPAGSFVLAGLDSAGVPVPDGVDVLVVLTALHSREAGYISAGMAVLGSVIGCLILYHIGHKGGRSYLERKTQTGWPKTFRLWFLRYGGITVFIPALLPIPLPLKVFVLSAGAFGMPVAEFLAIVLAARVPRYFGLAYLGSQLGQNPLEYLKHHAGELAAVAVGLFMFLVLLVKMKDWIRRRRRRQEAE
jgi:membrane protein DedA with SNARE-associated domain